MASRCSRGPNWPSDKSDFAYLQWNLLLGPIKLLAGLEVVLTEMTSWLSRLLALSPLSHCCLRCVKRINFRTVLLALNCRVYVQWAI